MDEHDFGEAYFSQDFGRPYRRDEHYVSFFDRIADAIVTGIRPRRVLDAGCAMGMLVEALRQRGVEAYGFDLSSYALEHVPAALRPYCWQASLTDEIEGTYDLIVCQEVFPHLSASEGARAVANLCRHSEDVLFSVQPYPAAPRHANTELPEHWAGVFARHGFYRDFDFDASVITPFAVRYRRSLYTIDTLVHHYERRARVLRTERDGERARRLEAETGLAQRDRGVVQRAARAWQKAMHAVRPTGSRPRG